MPLLYLLAGIVLLYFGAEGLVRGSSSIALRAGLRPIIVGLTVVAFGTSCPELVVSINAAINGTGDLSIGNVIGSNIFNITFILGGAALIYPMKVELQLLRRDAPLLILFTLLFGFFLIDKTISRIDAITLLIVFIFYMYWLVINAKSIEQKKIPTNTTLKNSSIISIILIVFGLAALVVGAQLFVKGGVLVAQWFKISQAVIGLTIIAAGTSLPELATTIIAAIRKENDIAIGNVIGSNIFNILAIIGIGGTITPISIIDINYFDLSFMIFTAVVLLPFMWTGFTLNRIEGILLVVSYCLYIVMLIKR